MSSTVVALAPLSDGVQIGLRVPVILLGLLGLVLALVKARRLGVAATAFAVVGTAMLTIGQVVDGWWALRISSMIREGASEDDFNLINNLFTAADVILVTMAAAFLVMAILIRRPHEQEVAQDQGYPQDPYPPGYETSPYGSPIG
jgi:hypothetical protein